MTDESVILTKIEHIQEDIRQIKSDLKEIREKMVPAGTFWKVSAALFFLSVSAYGAYLI